MGRWAAGTSEGGAPGRIGHMGLVVRTVQILAIPACWEDDGGPDAPGTHLRRKVGRVASVARRPAAAVFLGVSVATVADAWE